MSFFIKLKPAGRFFLVLFLIISCTLLPVFLAELAARTLLVLKGIQPSPFLFDKRILSQNILAPQQLWGNHLVLSYLDPHLGFAHDTTAHPLPGKIPGFVVYKSTNRSPNNYCFRIVALGGSTTDPLTAFFLNDYRHDKNINIDNPYNWPRSLQIIMETRGVCVEVYNGGVIGYSSSQDLLKLVRDVIPLKPDLVIMLQGINDLGFIQSVSRHPMVHNYQRILLRSVKSIENMPLIPNIYALMQNIIKKNVRTITGFTMGPEVNISSAKQWAQNAQIANAISQAFDFKLLVILQPILGFDNYAITEEEEQKLIDRAKEQRILVYNENYLKKVRFFYSEAKALCHKMPFTLDLTNIFADKQDVYLDHRHYNLAGTTILAETIAEVIRSRNLLEQNL